MAERLQAKRSAGKPDWWLFVLTLLIVAVGIIMVFSSSQYFAQYAPYNDAYHFLKRQLVNAAIGLFAMLVVYRFSYRFYQRVSKIAFIGVLALLLFMVVSTNIDTIGGAQRWLEVFGFRFQPSEFAKIVLPMVLADYATRHQAELWQFKKGFLPCLGLIGLTAGLIFLQKDLSSAVVVAAAGIILIFCAGCRILHLLGLGAVGIGAVGLAIWIEPFRIERVLAWFDPWSYAKDEGWQTVQSLMAIGSGGLTGVGLGAGGSKWYYLPERHTDFIFSVLCEEMGFLGALVLVALIGLLIWRGIIIAVRSRNTYCSLLAIGLTGSLAVQSIVNLGVCTGLLPVTGITLPFVSYGGTSLICSMAMVGMLLNLSCYCEK